MNEFAKLNAQEIGTKAGFSSVEPVDTLVRGVGSFNADLKRYDRYKAVGLVDAVVNARLQGRESQNTADDLLVEKGERRAKGLPELNSSEFLKSVLEEEKAIVAGEKDWEGRVEKFLGKPSVEAGADSEEGELSREASGSHAKLERMKADAANRFKEMGELAKKFGAKTVIEAKADIDKMRQEAAQIPNDRQELVGDVLKQLLDMKDNPKRQAKILDKLDLSKDDIDADVLSGDAAAIEVFSDKIANALSDLAERTGDKKRVSGFVMMEQFARRFGADNQLVKGWVDRRIKIGDREFAYDSKINKHFDSYNDFVAKEGNFTRLLIRIANREKVNAEIMDAVGSKVTAERNQFQADKRAHDLAEEGRRLGGERDALNDRLEAARELVSTELQLKELKAYAKEQESVAKSTLEVLGKTKVLNGERDAMLAEVAKGKLAEKLSAVVGGEAYKSVVKFIETNGTDPNADVTLVTKFLDEVKDLMGDKGKIVDGKEIAERSEFMSHGTIEVGGKKVEVGMVVGVATDKDGTWTFSAAQRDAEGKITPDTSNVIYLNHEKIRGYVATVKATEESLKVFESQMKAADGAATIAGSESMADQHDANEMDISEVVDQTEKLLVAQKGLLAGALRPMGGKDATLAVALENMSKAQATVVEGLFNDAYVETVGAVAEKLKMNPAEVTPAVLAVAHAEAVQTGKKATEIIDFLDKHDERMAEAVAASQPELAKLASSLADLKQDKERALGMKDAGVREAALRTTTEREAAVRESARSISDAIEAEFVARTPESLRAKRPDISKVVADMTLMESARTVLAEAGMGDYAESVEKVGALVVEQSGMSSELARLVVSARDALSVLDKDPRSRTLQRALNSGDPDAMFVRINEVLENGVEAEMQSRSETARSGEREVDPERMSGQEKAEAFLKGDVRQDAIVEAVASSATTEDVQAFFEKMGGLALESDEGSASFEDFNSRVFERLQEANEKDETGDALYELIEENPENWSEMLTIMGRQPGRNRGIIRHAFDVAAEIIEQKKN